MQTWHNVRRPPARKQSRTDRIILEVLGVSNERDVLLMLKWPVEETKMSTRPQSMHYEQHCYLNIAVEAE